MASGTRSARARQPPQQRVAPPTPQLQPSSNAVSEQLLHAANGSAGYVTPQKTDSESPLTNDSRLTPGSELAFRPSLNRRNSIATVSNEPDVLGVHIKEVISVINRLEGLGLQQQQIQLPKCVVLGEQSSGKSSVIEAISGVRTPRAGGTCTRCPLFISLKCSSDPQARWTARVTLRENYTYQASGSGGKFPGWQPNPNMEEISFAECDSPDDLEEIIRLAQFALVHPWEEVGKFIPGRNSPLELDEGHTKVNFSPNVVCIYLTHSTLPNLSFWDLPGIISQSENPSDVPLVKQLVQDYVQNPDSLVLVACSLAADIATSIASGYARNKWGAGDRCIGVLTKPDLLPAGSSEDPLKKVLNGQELKFGHGYFVVKNPDQLMLNNRLSHHDAREQEREFFAATEPWCSGLQAHSERFGTANLQRYLSEELAALMMNALPTIHDQLYTRLHEVDAEMSRIPPPPPTYGSVRIVSDLVNAFSEHVRKEMEADYPHNAWENSWCAVKGRFLSSLLAMRPTMRTSGKLDHGLYNSTLPGRSSEDPVCVPDGDDDDSEINEPQQTPQKKRKVEDTPALTPTKGPRFPMSVLSTPSKMKMFSGVDYSDKGTVYPLDDVSSLFSTKSKSKIHDQLHPKIIEDMIKQTLKNWHVPLRKLFEELEGELKAQLREVFELYFNTRTETKLYKDAWAIVEDIMNTSLTEQRYTMAKDALDSELEAPYMFHKATFDDARDKMRETYATHRFETRLNIYMKEMGEHVGEDKVPPKERLRKDERVRHFLLREPYQLELATIARVTSYYVIAAHRFHDSVCMKVESKFFKRLRTRLRDDMEETLGIQDENAPTKAVELLEEPNHQTKRRKELEGMRAALLEGQHLLDDLQAKHSSKIVASQTSNDVGPPPFDPSAPFSPVSDLPMDMMQGITQSDPFGR